jgi:hypothetical protein
MGYAVATMGWDPFTCPACAPPAPGAPPAAPEAGDYQLLNDVLFLPLYSRDAQGRVIKVRPGR